MKDLVMNEKQKDALSEAGNIGAAYAATALSKLIDEQIMIDITKCKWVNRNKIPLVLGDDKKFVVGINMLIPTENLCSILMVFPYKSAKECCDLFSRKKVGTTKDISYREFVILAELGTICLCAYLNALSKLIDEPYIPTPPAVACDIIGSILEDVTPSVDTVNDKAIIIKTDFGYNSPTQNKGHFLFIPDRDFKNAILRFFKVDTGS